MPQPNIQPNTTRLVLISLVQDLEIIINAEEEKNFQHHKPESIVLYMVGGGGWGESNGIDLVNISHFPQILAI